MNKNQEINHLIHDLKIKTRSCMDNFVEFLISNNIPWKFPQNKIDPYKESIALCRWCQTPYIFIGRPELTKQFDSWICTSCTPAPNPRFIISKILSSYYNSQELFQDLCIDVSNSPNLTDNDVYDTLYRMVLFLVNKNE